MTINTTGSSDFKLRQLRVHFFYVVVILTGALIMVATGEWTKLDGFTEYLGVAATVTSLVLGILAIIYSFVTSNSTNSFLGSVEASTRDVKSIGSELHAVLARGQDLQVRAEKRNEELHELVSNLRSAVDSLSANTTNIAGAVEVLPGKLDSLRSEFLERAARVSGHQAGNPANAESVLSREQLKSFISQSSIIGLTALKALCLAKSQEKAASFAKLFTSETIDSFEYAYGFLVSASCFDVVNFKFVREGRLFHNIVVNEHLSQLIEEEWVWRKEQAPEQKIKSLIGYEERLPGVPSDPPET